MGLKEVWLQTKCFLKRSACFSSAKLPNSHAYPLSWYFLVSACPCCIMRISSSFKPLLAPLRGLVLFMIRQLANFIFALACVEQNCLASPTADPSKSHHMCCVGQPIAIWVSETHSVTIKCRA